MSLKRTYLFLVAFMLNACMYQPIPLKTVVCPEPEQNCKSVLWNGINIDTTKSAASLTGFYYQIEQVQRLNTNIDEWQLSYVNSRKSIVTVSESGIQKMRIARPVLVNRYTIESGLEVSHEGHVGSATIKGDEIYFSAAKNVEIKNSSAIPQKVDLESSIGISRLHYGKIKENSVNNSIEIINDDAKLLEWYSHPAISPNGNIIFFSSDKESETKGIDIWFSYKMSDGKWSNPINCGDSINSKCDDITPFVSKDGKKLYFASAGHESVGGYDLFYCEINPDFWKQSNFNDYKNGYFSKVKNLRAPVNTIYDEIYPTCPGDCDSVMYYSSNQSIANPSSNSGFDIYVKYRKYLENWKKGKDNKRDDKFEANMEIDTTAKEIKIDINPDIKLYGKIYQKETGKEIPTATVQINELNKENKSTTVSADNNGNYEVILNKSIEYKITAQSKESFYYSFNFYVDIMDSNKAFEKNFYLPSQLNLRINFPLDEFKSPYSYILDSNGIETNQKWQDELDIVAANIMISIEKLEVINLVGHTDDLASVEYNNALGLRRVNFVVDELVKRGVPINLLKARSAGKLEPLDTKESENVNQYRKRLRRVTMEKVFKK